MISFDMNKHNPVPLKDFDANFVNNLGNMLWSFTLTIIVSLLLFRVLSCSILTRIVPSTVNLIALFKRFEITCDILTLSAFTRKSIEIV